MKADRMTVNELAKALGKSPVWTMNELRKDAKREMRQYPFATSTQNESGRWSYVIHRGQFERWRDGNFGIDYVRLADLIVDLLKEGGVSA